MSALLDSLTPGGYTGEGDGGIGASSYSAMASSPASSGDFFSGLLQSVTALGTGYLSKRMDIDLQQRYFNSMPQVAMNGTQNQLQYGGIGKGANGQYAATLNLSNLMPLALVAVVVIVLMKKKGG